MSDVILYAAIIERDRLKAATASGSTALDYSQPTPGGYPYVTSSGTEGAGQFTACPQIVKDWVTNLTPLVCPTQTYGFKVCDNNVGTRRRYKRQLLLRRITIWAKWRIPCIAVWC